MMLRGFIAVFCYATLSSHAVAAPLAVLFEGRFDPTDIEQIRSAGQHAFDSETLEPHGLLSRRTFGITGHGEGAGHAILFLHEHLDQHAPNIRNKMFDLALEADSVSGWNTSKLLAAEELALKARCFELISYHGNSTDDNASLTGDDTGWHADGASLITLAVVLSAHGDYKGGGLEFKDINRIERYNTLSQGDVVAWRGWTHHQVKSVLQGRRDIFVVEWWLGADCAETLDPRGGPESTSDLRHALSLDPTSGTLRRFLGESVCDIQPCGNDQDVVEAETLFRKALATDPKNAVLLHALGRFLASSNSVFKKIEGARKLKEAHQLSPDIVGPVSENLALLEDTASNGSMVIGLILVVALLFLCVMLLERAQARMAQEATKKKKVN
mmetsp:Transcript_99458/g.197084  ORF Transcript_99458/g.197084 Transcript_99458/m.197084 type:complete len:385 (-) Transcript_99458:131-1285(-)|eukprot:CAMPEP_0172897642 /NCGR_PEP_ID=MMETSP1075-20121228/157985_1 /TAXON_ID=2916 /ORGANISM="Ceratium fusus, Strain PA161109" /LENGTH=384 /DNA_ID=CAMNT_0013753265 /DNA_START=17 /DNA_END=1171 /DNA_ORIENTATION=-